MKPVGEARWLVKSESAKPGWISTSRSYIHPTPAEFLMGPGRSLPNAPSNMHERAERPLGWRFVLESGAARPARRRRFSQHSFHRRAYFASVVHPGLGTVPSAARCPIIPCLWNGVMYWNRRSHEEVTSATHDQRSDAERFRVSNVRPSTSLSDDLIEQGADVLKLTIGVSELPMPELVLEARDILETVHVAVVPGTDFGVPHDLRLAFCKRSLQRRHRSAAQRLHFLGCGQPFR